MAVFVRDKRNKPLMPCSEKRARTLLASGRARVHRLIPFAIRLIDQDAANCWFQPVNIKIDPARQTTGAWVWRLRRVAPVTALAQDLTREKRMKGFQTGDMARADVATGKKAGHYVGRVAVRRSGYFNVQSGAAVVQGISHRFCRVMQRADGYGYSTVAQSKELRDLVSHKRGTLRVPRSTSAA